MGDKAHSTRTSVGIGPHCGLSQSRIEGALSITASAARYWLRFAGVKVRTGLQGALVAVDVGTASFLHGRLLMPGLEPVRTVLESDLGSRLVDVNYFDSLKGRRPTQRLFICR